MTTNVSYGYAPAFKQFKDDVKIVHFIGAQKPWYYTFNADTEAVTGQAGGIYENEYLINWWRAFMKDIYPKLDQEIKNRLSTQIVGKSLETVVHQQQWHHSDSNPGSSDNQGGSGQQGVVVGSGEHLNLWEKGHIEYTGRDSFSNIQAHIDSKLQKK